LIHAFASHEQKLTTKPIQSSLEFGSSPGATGCIASPKSGTGCGVAGPAGYLASAANCACGAGLATETSQAVNDVDGWFQGLQVIRLPDFEVTSAYIDHVGT